MSHWWPLNVLRWVETFSFGQEPFCTYMPLNLEMAAPKQDPMKNLRPDKTTCRRLNAKSHHNKNHLKHLSLVTCHLVWGQIDHYVCTVWVLWVLCNDSHRFLKGVVLEIAKNAKQIIDEKKWWLNFQN